MIEALLATYQNHQVTEEMDLLFRVTGTTAQIRLAFDMAKPF